MFKKHSVKKAERLRFYVSLGSTCLLYTWGMTDLLSGGELLLGLIVSVKNDGETPWLGPRAEK